MCYHYRRAQEKIITAAVASVVIEFNLVSFTNIFIQGMKCLTLPEGVGMGQEVCIVGYGYLTES